MQSIKNILDSFETISLQQMDSVQLMNRTDTKFVFELELLGKVLNEIREYYYVLDINNKRMSAYRSLYYDTDDFEFYFEHHNGKTNRNKVRYREYIDSGLCFLEIKHKTNKGKTIKKRIKVDKIPNEIDTNANTFITSVIGEEKELVPKHWNKFNRITLVNKKIKERLTIDVNINFKGDNKTSELENMVIAEVKQEKINYASAFMRIIKKNMVRPFRISKYCIATASLYPLLKNNNFKPKFLKINKLQHDA